MKVDMMSKYNEMGSRNRRALDYELIRVLLDDKHPSGDEALTLRNLKNRMGDGIFSEAIYELTHITIEDSVEAKSICRNIIDHKKNLSTQLGRDVGIIMSALDYITNVRNRETQFMCMDQDRLTTLTESSISDFKTPTFSSTLLYSDIDREIERSKRYDERFSLVFADIDRFSQINNDHGHIFGDKILVQVSENIRESLRKSDSVYRYGGDEFVILLPETDETRARNIALKLKDVFRNVTIEKLARRITSSIGVVSYEQERLNNARTLFNAAEEAVIKAKGFGGDTVCVYKDNRVTIIPDSEKKASGRKKSERIVVKGEPIVSGRVTGKIFRYEDNITRELKVYSITDEEAEKEYQRIKDAIFAVEKDLDDLMSLVESKLDKKQLDILQVHKFILKDKELLNKIETELRNKKLNSEAIIKYFFEEWENQFHSFESPELRSKSADVADLGRRILKKLIGITTSILDELPDNAILFSTRILPTDIVHLKKSNLRAIVTLKGSRYSHAAILAKALEIPFISKIDKRIESFRDGANVLVDGFKGRIIINPTQREVRETQDVDDSRETIQVPESGEARIEYGNEKIKIFANIETAEDSVDAARYRCDGIGLTRLEYLYILNDKLPTRDTLYEQLVRLYEPVADLPVTIRLLDIGGDKLLPYMNESAASMSKMGTRGIRYLLRHPDLLADQLFVFLKLQDRFSVKVLIPMVTLPSEIKRVRKMLLKIAETAGMKTPSGIKLGSMIEVPSAVLSLDSILDQVDFISIGSNDLVQYTMAADREEAEVSDYYERGNAIIIKSIEYIVRKAKERQVECSLCGELAGDLKYTKKLLACGLTNFSVAPYLIPKLKNKIRSLGTKNK
jgi:phosphoenolpyruvate-protein phosphotransferase